MAEESAEGLDWGRNLHRSIRPFRICERPIVEQGAYVLRLMLDVGEQDIPMMGEQPRFSVAIDQGLSRTIRGIEFGMPFEKARLCAESGVEAEDIDLALLLKDFKTRNVLPVSRWPLLAAPDRFTISRESLAEISLADDFEVSIVAYLKRTAEAMPGVARTIGATLARCDLTIAVEGDTGPDFQVTTITPDDLEQRGFGRNALFVIDWEDEEDFSKPAKDIFVVRVNEIAAQKLMQIQGANTFGSAFYKHMMADILFQAARKILATGIDPNWPENSAGRTLIRFIEKNTGVPAEKIQQCASGDIDRLQALLQSALELATSVQNANLTGRN